jgi:multiple sugar transport system substrate-binding protein
MRIRNMRRKMKMRMKKIIALICSISVVAAMSGCQKNKSGLVEDGKEVITLSVLRMDNYLQEAIEKYETEHKDITFEVKEYSPLPEAAKQSKGGVVMLKGDPRDIEKYTSTVNTEIMSGKGSDIIMLQDLPYEKYAEKGLLQDFSSLMENDKSFNKEDYYKNVLDAINVNGKIYGMPLGFGLNLLSANKSILKSNGVTIEDNWTWQDFEEIAAKVAGGEGADKKYALSNTNESELTGSMVQSSFEKFVDSKAKEARFDSKDFIDLLNTAKKMVDNGLINTEKASKNIMDLTSRGASVFNIENISMPMELSIAKMGFGNDAEFYNTPGTEGGCSFNSNSILGINSKSKYTKEAWDFIKYLLSEEVQGARSFTELPVNKKTLEKKIENASSSNISEKKMMIKTPNGSSTSNTPVTFTEEDGKIVLSSVDKLSKYVGSNTKIINIVKDEVPAFFSGQKSAEDVAKTVQNKVNTYLKE